MTTAHPPLSTYRNRWVRLDALDEIEAWVSPFEHNGGALQPIVDEHSLRRIARVNGLTVAIDPLGADLTVGGVLLYRATVVSMPGEDCYDLRDAGWRFSEGSHPEDAEF